MSWVSGRIAEASGVPQDGAHVAQRAMNRNAFSLRRGPKSRAARRRLRRRGRMSVVTWLFILGLAQGCAHKAASGPPARELVAEAPDPTPQPDAAQEPPTSACKRLDDARLFWGVWSKVCGTLSGGAAAGTVATAGDPQKVVGLSGLGLLACSVATGYLETELAVRHTRQCR